MLLALVVCAAVSVAPAFALRGHVFESSFGKAGSGDGEFSGPSGVAVDEATGDVYVVDKGNGRVEYFTAAGVYVGQFNGSAAPTGQFSAPEGITVDNACFVKKLSGSACLAADPSDGDVYVVDKGHSVIDKFSPEGTYLSQITGTSKNAFEGIEGVATDANGTVWVYEQEVGFVRGVARFSNGAPNVFVSFTETKVEGSFGEPVFAVGCKGVLYEGHVGFEAGVATPVAAFAETGSLLTGSLDSAHSATAAAVEGGTCDVYLDNGTSVERLSPEIPGKEVERFGEEAGAKHLQSGAGLSVSVASEDRVYVTDAAADVVDVFSLEPPGPPTAVNSSVSEVTANSATFRAEVNPHGAASEYHFEYGLCATAESCASSGYETTLPDQPAGSGFEPVDVSAHPQDLKAGEVYHARVTVHNALGSVHGEELTFTAETAGVFELPDGRSWEMVSPPEKHGSKIESDFQGELVIQAAANGDGMTYLTSAPTETDPQGFVTVEEVLSTRSAAGWGSRDIGIPHVEATGQAIEQGGNEFRFFSENLSSALVQPFGGFDPALSEGSSEQTPVLRTNYQNENPSEPCTAGCYHPLVTGCPPPGEECSKTVEENANVPAGTSFSTKSKCPTKIHIICGPEIEGSSPDAKHVLLMSKTALEPGATVEDLYEWNRGDGTLQVASVLPASEGGTPTAATLGRIDRETKRADTVSDDGSLVVFAANKTGRLYARNTVAGETVRLDAVQGGSGAGAAMPIFQTASNDDSKVLFTDGQQLTANSGATSGEPDLYQCEMMLGNSGELGCNLSDLTPANGGEAANVQGVVLGAGQDASHAYLVAKGVLASNHNQAGETPVAGQDNLYASHDGVLSFIAVLSPHDETDWGGSTPSAYALTTRVSPDGQWLAFMSQRQITGYDSRDARSGHSDEEFYLYNAPSEKLVCASCDPTGGRPVGVEVPENAARSLVDKSVWAAGTWLAASISGWTSRFYASRYLSNDGRLFFNSYEALEPQDVDGTWDVYEYEPPEIGTCTTAAVTFSARSDGCVGLISSGTSSEESAFLDAGEGGGDVFFVTASKLASQDSDTSLDVYDAHECTPASPCLPTPEPPSPPCTTEASCRAAPVPQPAIFGAPASQAFSGIGNLAPGGGGPANPAKKAVKKTVKCGKGRVKNKQNKCVPKTKKKKVKRARKASRNGRGNQ
jgi:hypothetical protein